MTRIFLALVALVGLMWLASWLGKASPAQRGRALKLIVLYGIAGALLLSEVLAPRGYLGCALMFGGMLLAQLWPKPLPTELSGTSANAGAERR